MSGNGKKKAPLVADRRYSGSTKAKAKPASKSTKRRAKPARRSKRRGPIGALAGLVTGLFRWIFRLIWRVTWYSALIVAGIIGLGILYYASTLPPVNALVDGRIRGSVILLDREGEEFAWRGDQFRGVVTAETVSPHLRNAVVATEDKRFYRHFGISPRGIASAVRINLQAGRGPLSGNGGSTITQQTAKLLCLGREYDPEVFENETEYERDCRRTTLWRKVQEAVYSMAMELRYSKDDILTLYLNRAYLGAGARGFESAAQRYFARSAAEVTPAQAAMLAGLLKAPTTLAPTNNLERSQDRAALVIFLMEEQGYLSESAAQEALDNPAQLSAVAASRAGGWFADWVMDSGPEFFTRNTTEDVIIQTTLDRAMQRQAEDALAEVFENRLSESSEAQAAIVVMTPDGAVRAMVGGRDGSGGGSFNRATQASRQPGSAFKPFVYATALELGYSPNDLIEDAPLCLNIAGSGEWCPRNYTNSYRGTVTLTEALTQSLNTPAVRLYQ
ncbi:MAG: transglycosylase domain-containing protein, partial [Marivita sp.]|uniref:transglycosylase domain-containing protein n=1 Tax=Marivita sp. TaxID=2003365 RepID=UPI003EF27B71